MNFVKFLRSPFFAEHPQWLLLTVPGFPNTTLWKKVLQQRCISVNFAKLLRASFDQQLQMTASYCLSVNFEKFFRSPLLQPLRNCLFHVQVAEFQPSDTVKTIPQVFFKYFIEQREVAIGRCSFTYTPWKLYVKKLICNEFTRCQPARKKTLSHILLHVFCLYFPRIHHIYFFGKGFESVREQFLTENRTRKWHYLYFFCSSTIHLWGYP